MRIKSSDVDLMEQIGKVEGMGGIRTVPPESADELA
jgi:hypothetical protein